MNYGDKIISDFAESACKTISKKVIRKIQKLIPEMQSGDDSLLKNVWDEICVQVQGEESWMWDIYLETISTYVASEVKHLNDSTKQAIWLQTQEGFDWETENEDKDTVDVCEDDIIWYIVDRFILSEAANWTNKRIEKYLEREYDW